MVEDGGIHVRLRAREDGGRGAGVGPRGHARQRGVELEVGQLAQPQQRGEVVAEQELAVAAAVLGMDQRRLHEGGQRRLGVLLVEVRRARAVRVARERDQAVAQVGEHERRDARQVAQQVALAHRPLALRRGPERLAQVARGQLVGPHRQPQLLARLLQLAQHGRGLVRRRGGAGGGRRFGRDHRGQGRLQRRLVGAQAAEDGRAQVSRRGRFAVLHLDHQIGAHEGGLRRLGVRRREGRGGHGQRVEARAQLGQRRLAEAAAHAPAADERAVVLARGEEQRAEGGRARALARREPHHRELGGAARLDLGPAVGAPAGQVAAAAALGHDALQAERHGPRVGVLARRLDVLHQRHRPGGEQRPRQRLLALLNGHAREVAAVEVRQVEGEVGHGLARGGGHGGLAAQVHALLQEFEGGDATLVEGHDLAVEKRVRHGLGGERGGQVGVVRGEVDAAAGVERGRAARHARDGADAVQLRFEEPVRVGEGFARDGGHGGQRGGQGGGPRPPQGGGRVVGGRAPGTGQAALRQVGEGEAGDDGVVLRGQVARGVRHRVRVLEQEPAVRRLHERPGALQLAAPQLHGELARSDAVRHGPLGLRARGELGRARVPHLRRAGARVPDDDAPGPVLVLRDDALEGGVGEGVVLGHDGVAAHGGVARGAARHGPRLEHAAHFDNGRTVSSYK